MLKFLLIAIIGYFIFSRLFGKIVIIKKTDFKANDRDEPNTRVEMTDKKPKSIDADDGDYIDYEEIK